MSFNCQKELCKLGITDRKTFNKWSLKGHPDKGGDGKYYAQVINCRDSGQLCKSQNKTTAKKKKPATNTLKLGFQGFQRDRDRLCTLSVKTLKSFPLYKKTVPYWQKSKKKKEQLCELLAKPESELHDRSLPKRRYKTKRKTKPNNKSKRKTKPKNKSKRKTKPKNKRSKRV